MSTRSLTWTEQKVSRPECGCHRGTKTGSWLHPLQRAEGLRSSRKQRPTPKNKWQCYNHSGTFGWLTKHFRKTGVLRTIIAVSIGEADTRRDPLGDQAIEVTGEWPGCERTWAQPEEGLQGCKRGNTIQWFNCRNAFVVSADLGLWGRLGQNVFIVFEHLVDSEQGSTCQTNKQFWQATARAEAHSGFHCTAAMFLCSRCFRVGVVALIGITKEQSQLKYWSAHRETLKLHGN